MKSKLIIFVKNPELGKAKTRLAATIGDKAALAIYQLLLEKTAQITQDLAVDKVVYYDRFVDKKDIWPNDKFSKDLQKDGHLGIKMETAFYQAFQEGYDKVCIIGSDCYDLSAENLRLAFNTLDNDDAVIGPAEDGGYYLLGLSGFYPDFFKDKTWSTDTVGSDTIKDFEKLGLSFSELPVLSDVDVAEDLGPWANQVLEANE